MKLSYKFKQIKIIILLTIFLPVLAIAADAPSWQIVPSNSTISFTATQNNAPVMGTFKNFSGQINFDPTQLNASKVKIIIDMNSVSTSYSDIQDTLKTADWFNVKMFPEAIFTANNFVKTGNNSYIANGTLTIRDKTVPTALNFILEQYSNTNALVKGSALLKRTQFGVGQGDWASTAIVKDDVQINFTVAAVKK